jgi:uncharacterized membrane protein YbhN (UPF0104 family)
MAQPIVDTRKKKWGTVIRWASTLITTALFVAVIANQKWDVVLQKAAGIAPWSIALAVLCFVAAWGFNTLRWCSLLWTQDVKISFWQAFRMVWAGTFASNFLLSTIGGDGFRMVGILRYTDRKSIGVGSVVLDRIINMLAMTCLVPLPFVVFGGSLLSGLVRPAALLLPEGLRKLFERFFPKIAEAVRGWASRPSAFVYAFLAAWPSNLLPMLSTYLIAQQLGMNVTFVQVMAVQTVTYFVSQLPSINGYGLREGAYTTLYTALGASLEQASTLALVTRFISVLATVPGALWLSKSVTDVVGKEV